MDTKKLKKWANLLLDTGKRNNLISFKDTKASTVEVVIPSSVELLRKADSTASFEVFDPKTEVKMFTKWWGKKRDAFLKPNGGAL